MKKLPVLGLLAAVAGALSALPAQAMPNAHPQASIQSAIDEGTLSTFVGNTRPEATADNDMGQVDDTMLMDHLQLLLQRSPAGEAALTQYIADLHDPKSANYHQWLTPDQFAASFGVAQADVATVTSWLQSKGFTVNGVTPTGLIIDFTGTAGQVRTAFHTSIHNLSVGGVAHIANYNDPQIPAALAPAVAGIVSLSDFRPHPHLIRKLARPAYTVNTSNGTFHELSAGDLATIYNLTPLFQAGYSGQGQTIMVLEDTNLFSAGDWTVFRKAFGLTRAYPQGTLTQVNPTGALSCKNPGSNGDDGEAAIDVEWASAGAPNAAIVNAACSSSLTNFGGIIALTNVLNGPAANLPSVVSMSYGESETEGGAALNATFNKAFQQAVTQGVSIFVSSGDELGASTDGGSQATHGLNISGWASTPFNVAVGGTDFSYTADNVDPSTYWNASNSNTYSSALSYIQEMPWNDSCANGPFAAFEGMSPAAWCNSAVVIASQGPKSDFSFANAIGGSGGPSTCATGTPSTTGVTGGTCKGYAKPSWQVVFGNPADGVRDIPDVALFASNGFWDAVYPVCWSDPSQAASGATSCLGSPSTWAGFGGTSVSSPIMAAIQALVNQKTGQRWGNPNTVYYQMANAEYGTAGSTTCNSQTVNKSSNTCVFYDITEGDIVGACKPLAGRRGAAATTNSCFVPTGSTNGILSTSNTVSQPAFTTNTGWDFGTGIGSVNAYNLVMGWPTN